MWVVQLISKSTTCLSNLEIIEGKNSSDIQIGLGQIGQHVVLLHIRNTYFVNGFKKILVISVEFLNQSLIVNDSHMISFIKLLDLISHSVANDKINILASLELLCQSEVPCKRTQHSVG